LEELNNDMNIQNTKKLQFHIVRCTTTPKQMNHF